MRLHLRPAVTGLVTALFTVACAHAPRPAREPSNVEVEAARETQLTHAFQNYQAVEAFLITAPDIRGTRRAVCRVNVNAQRQLVPNFLPLAADARAETFGLPECRGEQLGQIADVAAKSNRPLLAGLPVALAAVCAVDFAFTAAVVMAGNHVSNRLSDRKSGRVRGLIIGGEGALAASAFGAVTVGAPLGWLGAGFLGAVCTGAGVAVGYWLVPLR